MSYFNFPPWTHFSGNFPISLFCSSPPLHFLNEGFIKTACGSQILPYMTEGGKNKYLILALPFFPLISFFSKLLSHFFYLNLTSFISDHEFFMKILSWGQTVLRSVPFLMRIQRSHWPYVAHRGHCRTLGAGIVKCPHVTCCGPTQDAPVTSSLGAGLAGGGTGSCSLLHPCCIWPRVGAQGISAELTHNFGIYINFR